MVLTISKNAERWREVRSRLTQPRSVASGSGNEAIYMLTCFAPYHLFQVAVKQWNRAFAGFPAIVIVQSNDHQIPYTTGNGACCED